MCGNPANRCVPGMTTYVSMAMLQTDTCPLIHLDLISVWLTKTQYLLAQYSITLLIGKLASSPMEILAQLLT